MNKAIKSILSEIPDKPDWNNTTSIKLKTDLIEWCGDKFKDKKVLEVGSHIGQTTMILGLLFKEAYTINMNPPDVDDVSLFEVINEVDNTGFYRTTQCNIKNDYGHQFDNVYHIQQDAYSQYGLSPSIPDVDVVFIDALHTYDAVSEDIENSLLKNAKYIVFDDYGLYPEIKKVVNDYIDLNVLKVEKHIGWEKGFHIVVENERHFYDSEGLICSVV